MLLANIFASKMEFREEYAFTRAHTIFKKAIADFEHESHEISFDSVLTLRSLLLSVSPKPRLWRPTPRKPRCPGQKWKRR